MGSNQRRLSRRFYRPLSFGTSQSAAERPICAVQESFSISCTSMPAGPENSRAHGQGHTEPRTASAGAVMLTVRPLKTSSTCQRQRLSRCSRQRASRSARRTRYARKRPLRSGSLEARLTGSSVLAIPGEFAAKFSGLELYRLVTSIVRLICGRSLRLSAGDSMLCQDRARCCGHWSAAAPGVGRTGRPRARGGTCA